jgi:hypothetical protein
MGVRAARRLLVLASVAVAVALAALMLTLLGHGGTRQTVSRPVAEPPCSTVAVTPPVRLTQPAVRSGHPGQAAVTIAMQPPTMRVPSSYLGMSTEYWTLPLFEHDTTQLARALSLLRVPGGGPLILRVDGDSADCTFWSATARRLPQWAYDLTPGWFAGTRDLLRRTGGRLILDLNLITDTPVLAAKVAVAAQNELPAGTVVAFEIGNEPDLYNRAYWLATISRAGRGADPIPTAITPRDYVHDLSGYARALSAVAPDVPLAGPALAYPRRDLDWIRALLATPHPRLGIVSAHLYPYSACVRKTSPCYPTIARLLSDSATTGLARTIAPAVRLAHKAGLRFRLTELNSVTCGGLPGVSNAFATALWAPDALFELMQAGVDGVNVHVREDAINGAFTVTNRGLIARPLLYGLILFARLLGPHAQLVHTQVRGVPPSQLKVWAVRIAGNTLHVLLIDKSAQPVRVHLRLPATGNATVERLLGPSACSVSGVTLDGQQLGSDGHWQGRSATESIAPRADGYHVTVPRASAALLTVALKPQRRHLRSQP